MSNKSNYNIRVFSEYPHLLTSSDNEFLINKNQIFKKQTLIPNDFKNKKILELGSGSGSKLLQFGLQGAEIYGIDGSSQQIKRIKANARKLKLKSSKAKFIIGKIEELESKKFPKFDIIICSAVLHHVHDWRKVISFSSKTIKSKGFIYLTWCDWTLHLSGWNIKNQISYRLGWNPKSRLLIGKFIFGWWDKRRNRHDLDSDSYFADLYAAYYIPISFGLIKKELEKNNFKILNALPETTVDNYLTSCEVAKKFGEKYNFLKKLRNTKLSKSINFLFRLRHFFMPSHGPRAVSATKK